MALRRYFGKISPLLINQLVGHEGEFVIDESTNNLYIMDGNTAGGHQVNLANLNIVKGNVYNNVIPISTDYYSLGNVNYAWNSLYLNDSLYFNNTGYINQTENTLSIIANNSTQYSSLVLQDDIDSLLFGNNSVWLVSGNGPEYLSVYWQFNPYGVLVFPDGTEQPTAFSNANVSTLNNLASNTALIPGLVTNAAYQATQLNNLNAEVVNLANEVNSIVVGTAFANAAQINAANSNINTLTINASIQASYINTLNSEMSATQSQIAVLQSNASTQETEISLLNANLLAANGEISILQANVNTLNEEVIAILGGGGASTFPNLTVTNNIYTSNLSANNNVIVSNTIVFSNTLTALNARNNTLFVNNSNLSVDGNIISGNHETSGSYYVNSVPGNGTGYLFTNGFYGVSGLTSVNLGNSVNGLSLVANGNPILTGYSNGISYIGGTLTTMYSNLFVSGSTVTLPNYTEIGLLPSFSPSNAKLTYVDNVNNYTQFLLQNKNSGSNASGDVVITADDGSDSTHYIDMGINSSTFSGGGGLDGPNDGYLLVEGGKLVIMTIDQPNDIVFAIGGDATSNEIGRWKASNGLVVTGNITTSGNVTIGGSLNVVGNITTSHYETISLTEYANNITASGNITTAGNVSATYYTGNGYYLTGLPATYGNTQVAAYLNNGIATDINITGNISPTANAVYSLGTLTNQWKSLYVSNNTIYIAGTAVQVANGSLIVGGNAVSSGSTYSNSNVSAYYVANTVTASNIQILNNGNIRLPTGATINDSYGAGYLVLSPNTAANALAGVMIGGSGYLISPNGSRNAVLNYNSISGQFGIYQVAVYGNQQNAIVNSGSNNFGNIGGISSFFGNLFVANIYSQGYLYPNGTSILSGIGGTYSNSNVAAYLPTYNGNIGNITTGNHTPLANIAYNLGNSTLYWANVYANNFNAATQIATPKIQFTVGGSQILEDNPLDLAIIGPYQVSIKGNGTQQYTFGNDGSFAGPGGYIAWANGAIGGNVIATGIYWSNGVAFSSGGGGNYGNTQVAAYLPTYAGNVNANFYFGNGYYLSGITSGGSSYSNTNVAAYLVTYNGNISAGNLSLTSGASGNITGTGYVVAGNMVANTGVYGNSYYWFNNNAPLATTITGTFANANVAGYLPTYTGNVGAGNIILTNLGNIIAATNSNLSIRTYGVYNILTLTNIAGGYNSPPYTNQSLTGGSGTGMLASYSSVGGYISTITVTNAGTGYKNGDVLTVPGGLGSTVTLSNYNPNVLASKAYYWQFSQYDGNVTVPGNIIMPSNSYVLGDFTNSNVAYRTFFQTTTANATTGIYAVPSGTGTGASWQAVANSNPNNASKIFMATNSNVDVQLGSGINGSGTYLPLSFYNNNAAQMVIYPNGNVYMSNANPITTSGNVNVGNLVSTGNVTASYLITTGSYGNISGANVITANTFIGTNATISGNLYSPSQTGKSAALVAQNTSVTMDNIKVQWLNNGSSNANQLQLGSLSGTPSALYTYMFQSGLGGGTTGYSGSLSLSTTYSNIGSTSGTAGDMYMVTTTVGTNAYRISAITGSGYSNNLISIERLI